MPVSSQDLERALGIIADKEELKVTVQNSARGGLITGVSTVIGGLLMGREGFLAGSMVGGTLAYLTSSEFKPVSEVIRCLDEQDKERLFLEVKAIIGNLDFTDAKSLVRFLNGDGLWIRQQVIRTVMGFLKNELCMESM